MPVIVKDYKWKQTNTNVTISVPLNGVHMSKVEIFISLRYIKATYGRNFFEAILFDAVDDIISKCSLTPTEIIFELKKCEDYEWESLEPNLTKPEKLELKKQLLEEAYQLTQKRSEDLLNKKSELKRVAVRKQIETDTESRNMIDSIRKQEETRALGDVKRWEKSLSSVKIPKRVSPKSRPKKIVGLVNQNEPLTNNVPVASVRSAKTLEIDFTPRNFPTPSRESLLEEETAWLAKQAEARRSCGFVSEDIRPEERNPQFLKAKGDEFLKNKNYLGAISAYSFGIKISPNFVEFYISRSEAHLAIGNLHRVLQDCSSALEILKPECPSNLNERALCIGRRGMALCKLGFNKEGIQELAFSIKLKPDDNFQNYLESQEDNLETTN